MTETPLLDELERLGDAGVRLLAAAEGVVAQAQHEQELRRRAQQRARLVERVAAHLAENPDATANAVHRAVGGERQEVLRAVREVRNRCAGVANQQEAGTSEGARVLTLPPPRPG